MQSVSGSNPNVVRKARLIAVLGTAGFLVIPVLAVLFLGPLTFSQPQADAYAANLNSDSLSSPDRPVQQVDVPDFNVLLNDWTDSYFNPEKVKQKKTKKEKKEKDKDDNDDDNDNGGGNDDKAKKNTGGSSAKKPPASGSGKKNSATASKKGTGSKPAASKSRSAFNPAKVKSAKGSQTAASKPSGSRTTASKPAAKPKPGAKPSGSAVASKSSGKSARPAAAAKSTAKPQNRVNVIRAGTNVTKRTMASVRKGYGWLGGMMEQIRAKQKTAKSAKR